MLEYVFGEGNNWEHMDFTFNRSNKALAVSLDSMGEFTCDDQYFTKRSNDSRCLLFYTIEGSGEIIYNNKTYSLPAGTAAAINCVPYHHYYTPRGGFWRFFWIHYSGPCAKALTEQLNEDGLYACPLPQSEFKNTFKKLACGAQSTHTLAELETSLEMYHFLAELVFQKEKKKTNEYFRHTKNINSALEFMHGNFAAAISINEIAAVSSISKYHFIKIFSSLKGETPYQYLNKLRISHAKQMLLSGNKSVAEIAETVGFSDVKILISNFKKFANTTPARYRKNNFSL